MIKSLEAKMKKATDKLAAEEIPNTEGPANGFLKYSCSRNPLVGIEIPASSTAKVLLALMLMIS